MIIGPEPINRITNHCYQGISDCNIFLENIQKVPDMTQAEKDRWAAEVRFLESLLPLFGWYECMDNSYYGSEYSGNAK